MNSQPFYDYIVSSGVSENFLHCHFCFLLPFDFDVQVMESFPTLDSQLHPSYQFLVDVVPLRFHLNFLKLYRLK